jgi:hypothetical protein
MNRVAAARQLAQRTVEVAAAGKVPGNEENAHPAVVNALSATRADGA